MFKNVASQKLRVFVFDATTGLPKTGDAANLTAYVNKDWAGANVLTDTSATEVDSTKAPGYYIFDLAQAETNADALDFSGKSTTANMVVVAGPTVFTTPPNFSTMVLDSSGRGDISKISGTSQTAGDVFALATTIATYIDTEVAAIKAKTDQLVFTVANVLDVNTLRVGGTIQTAGDLKTLLDTIAGYIDTEVAAIYSRIGAPSGASIAADIAAVSAGTLTAAAIRSAVGMATANLDTQLAAIAAYIDTEIGTLLAQTTAASIRAAIGMAGANLDAQLAPLLTAAGDDVVDGTNTMREIMRGVAAALLGKASGMGGANPKFRNIADGKDVIDATADADGNRTAVVLDLS